MKRIALICLFVLLLCGCGNDEELQPTNSATESPTTVPQETEPPTFGRLEDQFTMDEQTDEQVERYGIVDGAYYGLLPMGDGVLLFSGETETTLTYVDRSNLPLTTVLEGVFLKPDDSALCVTDSGICYYDPGAHSLVTLDAQLMPVSRVGLSEEIPGELVLSGDGKLVYYHTGTQLRCLDWRSGISRLLKESGVQFQEICDLHFEDTLLRCVVVEGETSKTMLVSTETGETLFTSELQPELMTEGQSFFATWREWDQELRLCGQVGGETHKLLPLWEGNWFYQPQQDFAAAWRSDTLGVDLVWYSLKQDGHCANLRLNGVEAPVGMITDRETGELWFLARDKVMKKFLFYRWNPAQRPMSNTLQTLAPYYTAESPDKEGLQRCQETVNAMGQQYGLQIRIWEDAAKVVPQGYHVITEYSVERYDSFFPQLEKAISAYPEEIYQRLSKKSNNRKLTICLVREIYGSNELGSLTLEQGVFFIKDGSSYLLLTLNENIQSSYYHELFHAMDSYIIMESKVYDDWNALNPGGFTYDNSYLVNESRDPGPYLQNEYRAFIDLYSMSYPKEDRARIMEYAMVSGNEAYFTTGTMVRKLETLCNGIRNAFGLKEDERSFLWEQYLPQ